MSIGTSWRLSRAQWEFWVVTIYASIDDLKKVELWDDLGNKMNSFDVCWCLMGGFNVVEEKVGLIDNLRSLDDFVDFINFVQLVDFLMISSHFTWSNGRVFNRLNHFSVSFEFFDHVPNVSQIHLPNSLSDHNPVMICEKNVD
ncbi:Uncharacterized protein TCM_022783 [Theobroma cacao]|uniref:Endonuclease/exonuclease/phosphatase domain-containing protein n=1 Tax=Theobroma cacao TaxID=3641 RepID=A0A061F1J2_THECC|nr:Uncharacterized protein TCM_022783 [Theobroma cacao]